MYSSSMFLCSLTHLCTYITAFFGWFCITTNKYITMHYFLSRQLMAMQAITPHRQEKYTNIMHEVFEKTINVSKARIDNIDQDRKKKQRIETRDDHKYAEGGRSSLSTVNLAFPPRVPQPSFQNVGIRTRLNNGNAKTIQYESSSSRKSIVTVGSGHSTNVSSPETSMQPK